MSPEEIKKQIDDKSKEIEDLKFQLALKELVKDFKIEKFENNLLKDVSFVKANNGIMPFDQYVIAFSLNNEPIVITLQLDHVTMMVQDKISFRICEQFYEELMKLISPNSLKVTNQFPR